jgi:protein-S-isoprenylcysteine O-methyltransferase Ste14
MIIWFITIGFYYYIAEYEERILLEKFGEEYLEYMRDVPMFIPRFKKDDVINA